MRSQSGGIVMSTVDPAMVARFAEQLRDAGFGEQDAAAACAALGRALDGEPTIIVESHAKPLQARAERLAGERLDGATRTQAENEKRLQRALDLATVVVVGLGSDGRIQLLNREAERVLGYRTAEVAGARFAERFVVTPEDCGWPKAWAEVLAGAPHPVPVPARCVLRTRALQLRQLAGHMSREPDEAGEEPLVLIVGRDVSEERALAARLRRSEKLAAVGTLAAGLAHEIRNPLNGAQLHLTFLRRALARAGTNGDMADAVEVVAGEIKRLSALVTDFLSFARPRPLERRAITMQETCSRMAELVRPLADAADANVLVQLPEADIVAEVDPAMIEQALLNLLNNAIEALGSGGRGGDVTLALRRLPLDVVVEVRDDGPGIADPEAPIFDAFYSTKPNGTGLGLAIVHRIVTDHGGDIEVRSRPGETTFRVTLPLCDPRVGPAGAVPSPGGAASEREAPATGPRTT